MLVVVIWMRDDREGDDIDEDLDDCDHMGDRDG